MGIDESVKLGKSVEIGEYVVIEQDVVIGDHVIIGHHVVIQRGTIIGDHVRIDDSTSLGKTPTSNQKMTRKPPVELPPLTIGSNVNIGSNCVIYRGTQILDGVLVGDLASIRENVIIGNHTIVGRSATVENNTKIGDNVTVQTNSYITADMIIADDVFIGPCFASSNDKYMGLRNYQHQGPILKKGSKIGANATLLPGVVIGEQAIVGAGSVVTKDIIEGITVVGNPARELKK